MLTVRSYFASGAVTRGVAPSLAAATEHVAEGLTVAESGSGKAWVWTGDSWQEAPRWPRLESRPRSVHALRRVDARGSE